MSEFNKKNLLKNYKPVEREFSVPPPLPKCSQLTLLPPLPLQKDSALNQCTGLDFLLAASEVYKEKNILFFPKMFSLGHDANHPPNWWFEKLHMIVANAFFLNVSNVPANTQIIELVYSNFRLRGTLLLKPTFTYVEKWSRD